MPPLNNPAPRASRISYDDLKARIQAGNLEYGEVVRYFEVDQRAAQNLRFSVKLNPRNVKVDGKRPSAAEVNALMDEVTEQEFLKSAHMPGMDPGPPTLDRDHPQARSAPSAESLAKSVAARPRILNEGDSWFRLPLGLKPKDCMATLRKRFFIDPLAHWGDTLADMVAKKSYVHKLKAGTGFDLFMFSGGGNDVLGSIDRYVRSCVPGDTNPDNAANYIKPEFDGVVSDLIDLYKKMIKQVRAVSTVTIMLHGYANAIPVQNGKYIGRHLQAKGFQTGVGDLLSRKIVELMVGSFNAKLKKLANATPGVVYVDLRKTVVQGFWHTDEIHPDDAGAGRIADKFTAEINKIWPSA